MNDDLVDAALDRLVGQLAALGRVRVWADAAAAAADTSDPDAPAADATADWPVAAAAFLAAHPQMAADAGYRRCLQRLGGITVSRPAAWFGLNVYGFDPDEWPYLPRKDQEMADRPGFDTFAHIHYKLAPELPGPAPQLFAFSRSAPGIFRAVGDGPDEWFCDSFLAWLERVVAERAFVDGEAAP